MDNLFASRESVSKKYRAEKSSITQESLRVEKSLHKQIGRRSRNYLMCKLCLELPALYAALIATAGTAPLNQNENSNPGVILTEPTNPIID